MSLFLAFINVMIAVASHPVRWGFGSFTYKYTLLLHSFLRLPGVSQVIELLLGQSTGQAFVFTWACVYNWIWDHGSQGVLTAEKPVLRLLERHWSAGWPAEFLDNWKGRIQKGRNQKPLQRSSHRMQGIPAQMLKPAHLGFSAIHHLSDHGQVT